MDVRNDPLGERYWHLIQNQRALGAVLRDDWQPLRGRLEQARRGSGTDSARMNWEKLCLLGFMDVARSAEGWVMVKRGPQWEEFHEQYGPVATSERLWHLQMRERAAEIFADLN